MSNFFLCRYGRDYYINDSKSASGSKAMKGSGDLSRHCTIDDDDADNYDDINPENEYDVSDSVSDLDSFYSNRSDRHYIYHYAHLPKPMTLQMNKSPIFMKLHQNDDNDVPLKRSHSLCSVRTYGLRKRFNRSDCDIDSSSNIFYEKPQHKHQPQGGQTIAQLERDTLLNDIRRNSFSSRRGTRNFVINPLYKDTK